MFPRLLSVNRNDMLSPWVHIAVESSHTFDLIKNLTFKCKINVTVAPQRVGLFVKQIGNMKQDVRILLLGERESFH